jgi:hypothetical protein
MMELKVRNQHHFLESLKRAAHTEIESYFCFAQSGVDSYSAQLMAQSNKPQYIPLFPDIRENLYWTTLCVKFDREKRGFRLCSVGLGVHYGISLLSLFRAEWGTNDANSRTMHAQPHWHVCTQSCSAEVDFASNAFSDKVDIKRASGMIDLTRVHFAMHALWQEGKENAHVSCCNQESQVTNWLKYTLRYVKSQIRYAEFPSCD